VIAGAAAIGVEFRLDPDVAGSVIGAQDFTVLRREGEGELGAGGLLG
jgi:hypothetical protein